RQDGLGSFGRNRAGRRSDVRRGAGGFGSDAFRRNAAGVAAEGYPPGRAAPVRERADGAVAGFAGDCDRQRMAGRDTVGRETAVGRRSDENGIQPTLLQRGIRRQTIMSNREPRVLVVDDCEALRYLKMHYLRGAGFQVSQADTGNAALRSIEAERPDVARLDIRQADVHASDAPRGATTGRTL